jgi:hypothetical protein
VPDAEKQYKDRGSLPLSFFCKCDIIKPKLLESEREENEFKK